MDEKQVNAMMRRVTESLDKLTKLKIIETAASAMEQLKPALGYPITPTRESAAQAYEAAVRIIEFHLSDFDPREDA